MGVVEEFNIKWGRVRKFLGENNLRALCLNSQANFAWFTCGGDNHVAMGTESGVATVVVTAERVYILTTNIEGVRVRDEEVGRKLPIEIVEFPWWEDGRRKLEEIIGTLEGVVSDNGVFSLPQRGADIAPLRFSLTEEEIARYRRVGEDAGEAVADICQSLKQGMTEYQIAGMTSEALMGRGLIPVVILVAADDRVFKYRHPIPTEKVLDKYVMIVVCAKRWGLIVSLTRFVHFGKLDEELQRKFDAVRQVDAAFILNSKPGVCVGDIFVKAVEKYKEVGYPDEWKLHHQGGPTGYATRDYKATLGETRRLVLNQAVAWNPSITGTKSEDTIIVKEEGFEILTLTQNWPAREVTLEEGSVLRPEVLVR